MTGYEELVKALRIRSGNLCPGDICDRCEAIHFICSDKVMHDAAAAIEELQAEIRESMQKCAECGENEPKRGEMVEVVRCKDCKHRPTGTGVNHDIEFPDSRCPCQCYEDYWYSWMPSDDWYCGNGEKMEVQDGK